MHSGKRYIIVNVLIISILIISLLLGYFNLENLKNYDDKVSNLIGILGSCVLPFIVISIIIQILIMILTFTNKRVLNIISLIFEIIYFIFVNLTCVPFAFLNFCFLNELLGYLVFIGFEILNIYIIVLQIKMIIKNRKVGEKSE